MKRYIQIGKKLNIAPPTVSKYMRKFKWRNEYREK